MKYKFSRLEKFVVWKTHDKKCFWCGEPLTLKTQSIDHVIPEDLVADVDNIIYEYNLPPNFKINGFCNWVPSHNNCNSKKGFELFTPSPVFLTILNGIIKKSNDAQKNFVALENSMKASEALEKLLICVEEGKISDEEIIIELGYTIHIDKKIADLGLQIPDIWKVESVDYNTNIVEVSCGNDFGRTIIPPEDHYDTNYCCPTCRYYGPWSGSKCLSCGHYFDPQA